MAIMCGVVGASALITTAPISASDQRMVASYRMIAKMPTIAAWAFKYSLGQPFMYPRNNLNYAENFLHMMFATPAEDYEVSPVIAKALDRILILHADHEQNASTSTVRLAGSSGANPFACIAAGIAASGAPPWRANEAVLNMLNEIGSPNRIGEFIDKAKDPEHPFRLMGFGHRVYKNFDPRARLMRESCYEVLRELGIEHEPLLELALELERIALEDSYFVDRRLYPNVDFYSGIIFKAIGIPVSMFTVLFAVAHVEWVAHERDRRNPKVGRPPALHGTSRGRAARRARLTGALHRWINRPVAVRVLYERMWSGCRRISSARRTGDATPPLSSAASAVHIGTAHREMPKPSES